MQRRLAQRDRPLEPVEGLQLLERIALDAGAHRLADDGVQIDEPLGPQQPVELALARGVAAHQALERGRLVGREVIDVQPGKALPARHHEVDEGLEGRPLRGGIKGPARVILGLAGRPRGPAEQILEPARADEGIALEVEEDVARRGLGQAAKPLPSMTGSIS